MCQLLGFQKLDNQKLGFSPIDQKIAQLIKIWQIIYIVGYDQYIPLNKNKKRQYFLYLI